MAMTSGRKDNVQPDLEAADQGWRCAYLLFKLLEADEYSETGIALLAEKAAAWIHAERAEVQIIGLNLLRFLFKTKYVNNIKPSREKILEVFLASERSDVRLAALDLLSAMGKGANPVKQIPQHEAEHLKQFSARMLDALNASQFRYASRGARAEVDQYLSGKGARAAMFEIVERVEAG